MIENSEAKGIAEVWCAGSATHLYSFCKTGVVFDNLENEIEGCIDTAERYNEDRQVHDLKNLLKYVKKRRDKNAINGW